MVTSMVALTTSVLNHRWARETAERQSNQERDKELREQRRRAYARYWTTESRYSGELNRLLDATDPDGTNGRQLEATQLAAEAHSHPPSPATGARSLPARQAMDESDTTRRPPS